MHFVNTLTVNGQTFTIQDPNAATEQQLEDAVLCTAQELTDERKAQARQNIGAGKIDDSKIGVDAWSSKNAVDKLCPGFTECGDVVTCRPVEGYPLRVAWKTKNLLNLSGRVLHASTGYVNTTKRTFTGNQIFVGISADNYLMGNVVLSYTVDGTSVAVTNSNGGYGIGFDMAVAPGATYTLSVAELEAARVRLIFYQEDGTLVSYTNAVAEPGSMKHIVPDNAKWAIVHVFPTNIGAEGTATGIQLELGTTATAYEPYAQTATITRCAENQLDQCDTYAYEQSMTIPALAGVNTIYADVGLVTVTGRADPTAVIEKLTNAIIALGGKV